MQEQMTMQAGGMPQDPKQAFKAEWEALEVTEHNWALRNAESDMIAVVGPTKDELYHNLTREMADYCMRKMRPYVDPNTGHEVNDAYDYLDFTSKLFQKS